MKVELTKEVLEKVRTTKNAEELFALAKENGIELTMQEAQESFEKLVKTGEMSDDELDNVSGGCSGQTGTGPGSLSNARCPYCQIGYGIRQLQYLGGLTNPYKYQCDNCQKYFNP